ncbi:hypothetical protein KKF91_19650, partial [Myxococcota bacterium]|nr:hypothetical protein [Myxococcota bacterium]
MRVLFVVLTLALGCSEPSSAADEDAGAIPAPRVDAQLIVRPDAGPPGDAGRPGDDAARPGDDAALPLDAARPGDDAARPGDDAARPGDDADLPLDAERPGDAARPGDDAALPLDAARPSDVGVSPDAGDDPCEGLTLCAEPAWSCEGDVAVACWYDDNDCLVATRTDCTLQLNGYCSTEGVLPGCREGEGICGGMGFCPAERYCEGDTLHVCISDEEGCASTRVEQTCANEGKICVATQDGGADCVLASPEAVSAQIAAARAAIDGAARLPRAGDW